MLRDVVPFRDVWQVLRRSSASASIPAFIEFMERRIGARMNFDAGSFPYGSYELADLFETLAHMQQAGVIKAYMRGAAAPDEPQLSYWTVIYRDGDDPSAGGTSFRDERAALVRAIAETQERYLWVFEHDWVTGLHQARMDRLSSRHISPWSFAGYSSTQREHGPLKIADDTVFSFVRAQAHATGGSRDIPLQIVSARSNTTRGLAEPQIRPRVTTGIATHPDRIQALLSGVLEVIERDAYMITWFNQISPPRLKTDTLAQRSPSFAALIETCARYRLTPHIVRFPTDAPTYAIGCLVEDQVSGVYTLGIAAHADPAIGAEKALLEALRARSSLKREAPTSVKGVNHHERVPYWAQENRPQKLRFLLSGAYEDRREAWESDAPTEHWKRILDWSRTRGYECLSVSLTRSKSNLTGWHTEFVVMPDMQPMHLFERHPAIGGARLTEVPALLGYQARSPYTEEPHPFA